ncbi:NAD(P)-binding protein [Clathrospora elynae]|uniref:NAD(P)-binding protein n=1 Tax=Clathrospora elynae TaxID=706981 RepID=A0A6A5S6X8_9PLEO|nr:NAD(P)-binding protein [Clathrospora elynae]
MATEAEVQSLIGSGPPASVKGQMAAMKWSKQNPPRDPKSSFAGKTVIITGSNTGIGLPAATKFAANGASKVILAVRTLSKGEEAKRTIIAETGCEAESIDVLKLDLGDWASVKAFAAEATSRYDEIHIAVLNAGVATPKYVNNEKTGYDAALQVNILSTAYLAMLLLPKLKSNASKGTPGQLTFTGSFASKYVTPADVEVKNSQTLIDKLNDPAAFNAGKTYGLIKLVTQYIRQGLVDDFSKDAQGNTDVFINVACPGYCTTDLGRDFPWYLAIPTKLMQMFVGRTAEQGGRELVSATLLGKTGHNKFWSNDTLDDPGEMVTSDQGKKLQAQTWNEIRRICEKQGL